MKLGASPEELKEAAYFLAMTFRDMNRSGVGCPRCSHLKMTKLAPTSAPTPTSGSGSGSGGGGGGGGGGATQIAIPAPAPAAAPRPFAPFAPLATTAPTTTATPPRRADPPAVVGVKRQRLEILNMHRDVDDIIEIIQGRSGGLGAAAEKIIAEYQVADTMSETELYRTIVGLLTSIRGAPGNALQEYRQKYNIAPKVARVDGATIEAAAALLSAAGDGK